MGRLDLAGVFISALLLNITLHLSNAEISNLGKEKAHYRRKRAVYETSLAEESSRWKSCTRTERGRSRRSLLDPYESLPLVSPLTQADRAKRNFGQVIFFSGKFETLQLKKEFKVVIPRDVFTLSLWLRPEGGQVKDAIIFGLLDRCPPVSDKGWLLGLSAVSPDGDQDARYYFNMRTDRARTATGLVGAQRYLADTWTHLAVTYDKKRLTLYIDGASVASSQDQKGPLFGIVTLECKALVIGGGLKQGRSFRGAMDQLQLWNRSLDHNEIIQLVRSKEEEPNGTVLDEAFSEHQNWESVGSRNPRHVKSDVGHRFSDMRLSVPSCGRTVCDSREVIESYTANWQLRQTKIVRYSVINVMNDDGTNPTVTAEQIRLQDRALDASFGRYNITWKLDVIEIRNTSLRSKFILLGCDRNKIADGWCHPECDHLMTGNDGGDCDDVFLSCDPEKVGDGRCDMECNRRYHDFDGGDCCDSSTLDGVSACYNPKSPNRIFLTLDEYKKTLNLTNRHGVNVYFAQWMIKDLIGVATFPWEKQVYTIDGGVVIQPNKFGLPNETDSMIHEIGHTLGLWHVHYGVSEMDCDDPCLETTPSLELGDLCSDTRPTPKNPSCKDPVEGEADNPCTLPLWTQTPYNNYMSYAADNCTDHFSPQQSSRMHCYLDLMYQPWQDVRRPSPLPLKPKVVSATNASVTVAWIPPIGKGVTTSADICSSCVEGYVLRQYAKKAWSPVSSGRNTMFFAPHQATGAPDSDVCDASSKAWMPSTCELDCFIELQFEHPVIPKSVSVWVTWQAQNAIDDLELVSVTGRTHSLGPLPAFCDMPLSVDLRKTLKLVDNINRVRIHVSSPLVSIDAVSLESLPNNELCKACKTLQYNVIREPPLTLHTELSTAVPTEGPQFSDTDVVEGEEYTYRVVAVRGGRTSDPSPPLIYRHGDPFCGDAKLNSEDEECDDGNSRDGDGCSIDCLQEEFFHCQGEPSLCYKHDGDGVCEEFEKRSSVEDCGFYVPLGFTDQWAVEATTASYLDSPRCPPEAITGEPIIRKSCDRHLTYFKAWYPCEFFDEDDYWIEVSFDTPAVCTGVLVYYSSDGGVDRGSVTVSITLLDTNNDTHPAGERDLTLDCKTQHAQIDIVHDLSKPFYHTRGIRLSYRWPYLAIAGVAMRSSNLLDPVSIERCNPQDLYSPRTSKCLPNACDMNTCDDFMIKYGTAHCTGNMEGDLCDVHCEDGYELGGLNTTVTCEDGVWTGTVQCLPVDCGLPEVSFAKVDCPDGTRFGSKCKFDCKSRARKHGSGKMITCEADAMWSLPNAFCQVKCQGPPRFKDMTLVNKQCGQSEHDVGTTCKFKCNKGFHVTGQLAKRRVLRYTCLDTGSWEGQGCERVKCPPLNPIYIGLYSCTDSNLANSKCTLKCPGPNGESSKVSCLSTGEWNKQFTPCKFAPGECPTLLPNDDIFFTCDGNKIGDKCDVYCSGPRQRAISYRVAEPSRRRTRRSNMSETEVTVIVCAGRRIWYPDPQYIICIDQCEPMAFGDGFCDARNNHAHCEWDQGDCCASTVVGGLVQKIPHTCAEQCSCKDPNAVENKERNRIRRHHGNHKHRRQGKEVAQSIAQSTIDNYMWELRKKG